MSYIQATTILLCVPALLILSVLYARAARDGAVDRLRRGEAELALAKTGATLRASEEQRARLAKAVARYTREIRELQARCISVGDAADAARALGDLLSPGEDGGDPDAGTGPVPDWATTPADGADPTGGDG